MNDERNDLIRVGDALDAITDWLCDEEFRHHIEPNRKINRFFATVMLENVPRVADRKTEPMQDQQVQRIEYVESVERSRCRNCKHFTREYETPVSSDGRYYTYITCSATKCAYEPKDEPTGYKKWEAQPPIKAPTVNTNCVGIAVRFLDDEPQTERSE